MGVDCTGFCGLGGSDVDWSVRGGIVGVFGEFRGLVRGVAVDASFWCVCVVEIGEDSA